MNQLTIYQPQTRLNMVASMSGLSVHTQRAYQRWIRRYLTDNGTANIDFKAFDPYDATGVLNAATLKAWLGRVKESGLGKQSIQQGKAAVVWLAQFLADTECVDYSLPAALSRVKTPRAETGQRAGTWLTQDEVRQLFRGLQMADKGNKPAIARNTAIIILMATCGLRRDEIVTATWNDLGKQGRNSILKVHGKGEKLRIVKLPKIVVDAIEQWKPYHPDPTGAAPVFTRIWKGGTVSVNSITDKAIWMFVLKAAENAGLPRVTPHDLRRSFARGAYEAGVSFELIRQSLGHSNISTTERYVNSVLELDRAATDIWADAIAV